MAKAARARVFMSGRSQHVTIPAAYRFRSAEVAIRRDPETGEIVLSEIPGLDEVFAALDAANLPEQFLNEIERDRRPAEGRPALHELFGAPERSGKR